MKSYSFMRSVFVTVLFGSGVLSSSQASAENYPIWDSGFAAWHN